MVQKAAFEKLNKAQKEKVINALFAVKYPGFTAKAGIDIDVPSGYSIRAASLLKAEEQKEIVKKIFVILEEFNSFITSFDMDTLTQYTDDLKKTKKFDPERDEFWVIVNKKWTFEAYTRTRGKIVLMDLDTLVKGLNKYSKKQSARGRELRDVLRYYSL